MFVLKQVGPSSGVLSKWVSCQRSLGEAFRFSVALVEHGALLAVRR